MPEHEFVMGEENFKLAVAIGRDHVPPVRVIELSRRIQAGIIFITAAIDSPTSLFWHELGAAEDLLPPPQLDPIPRENPLFPEGNDNERW